MNQSNMSEILNNNQLANDIWAMFGASPSTDITVPDNQICAEQESASGIAPELEDQILAKLGEKKERAAEHLGISAAEVETMPFDLTALEQEGIFLNIDATGFSVLSRQLDWRSLGIELPAEQAVSLSPPRAGLLPDKYRKSLQRGAAQAHNALNKYSFRFTLCETVLGSSEYKWIPLTAFAAFEKEYAAALETLSKAKAEVIENYDEILQTLRETFTLLAKDSADRLEATLKTEPINREEFIAATVARAMGMVPTVSAIRDGMRIGMRPKVILLGSEMRAETTRAAKLELEAQSVRKAQTELEIELQTAKEIAELKVKTLTDEQKREQELKERIRQIKIEAVKQEMQNSISPLKEGLEQLNGTIYEAATEMAEKLKEAKFIPGGMAKRAREMYRWFKLMNFTGDTEVENVLKELNQIASRNAKTRSAEEMKDALGAVILATSKRARKLLKTEQLDALEL